MSALKKDKIFSAAVIAKNLSGEELSKLMVDDKISHVCQEDGFSYAEELQLAERLSNSTAVNWKEPIYNVFTQTNLDLLTFDIGKDLDKKLLVEKVEQFLLEKKVKQTLLQDICLAVEETVSNVLMHAAPHIKESRIGQIQVAIDSVNLKAGFICQDFAGKMNVDKMLSKIKKCYVDGVGGSISMTTRGAGIGTFLVFHGAGSYFLFNKSGVSSFVGASYPIMADKKRLAFSKHFHIGNE